MYILKDNKEIRDLSGVLHTLNTANLTEDTIIIVDEKTGLQFTSNVLLSDPTGNPITFSSECEGIFYSFDVELRETGIPQKVNIRIYNGYMNYLVDTYGSTEDKQEQGTGLLDQVQSFYDVWYLTNKLTFTFNQGKVFKDEDLPILIEYFQFIPTKFSEEQFGSCEEVGVMVDLLRKEPELMRELPYTEFNRLNILLYLSYVPDAIKFGYFPDWFLEGKDEPLTTGEWVELVEYDPEVAIYIDPSKYNLRYILQTAEAASDNVFYSISDEVMTWDIFKGVISSNIPLGSMLDRKSPEGFDAKEFWVILSKDIEEKGDYPDLEDYLWEYVDCILESDDYFDMLFTKEEFVLSIQDHYGTKQATILDVIHSVMS